MKAVGLTHYLPVEDERCLLDLEVPDPQPGPHDLLVKVEAVSVNPTDYKRRAPKDKVESVPRVLGWDCAGTVLRIGGRVTLFRSGDRVYYAGDSNRPGCNSEMHVVDERIVGHMPASLDFAQAAALPLTALTAWESLFDRLRIPASPAKCQPAGSVLIVGGAGGVGSLAIQLAARVAGLQVIATASRPDSIQWCRELGARHVVNHFGDLVLEVRQAGFRHVDHVLILNNIDRHFAAASELVAPQGGICSIVAAERPLDLSQLRSKSGSLSWELMFTRSSFATPDMIEQHRILEKVAALIDNGMLRTTVNELMRPINAANLRRAHALLEQGRAIGKVVVSGFD